jgi:hypothetical protein
MRRILRIICYITIKRNQLIKY